MTTNRPGRTAVGSPAPISPWNGLTIAALPLAPTPMIGREHEAALVTEHLQAGMVRLVTLTGPGGIGKTRLAIELAHRFEVGFAGQVVFVALEAIRRPEDVTPAILHAIGLSDQGTFDPLALLTSSLLHTDMLMVLDNFEQVLAARADLAHLLAAAPRVRLLVTSRSRLRLRGEHVVPVPPLGLADSSHGDTGRPGEAVADAMRLFMERASASAAGLDLTGPNVAVVASICRRLDGVPLAIELAAARVSHLSPAMLDERLSRSLPWLVAGAEDLPDRHRTLRDTIAWSYDLLEPARQRLFRCVAVFRDGFSLEAAEAVMGPATATSPSEPEVIDGLQSLVEASLIMHTVTASGVSRYGTLETIREFAGEALLASGELDTTRQRHAGWYRALAESRGVRPFSPEATQRSSELAAEQRNMIAALEWLDATGDGTRLGRLGAALGWSWWLRGEWRSGQPWLDRVWDDPAIRGSLSPVALTSLGLALGLMTAAGANDPQRARDIFMVCREQALADGEPLDAISAGIGSGWVEGMTGDTEAGTRHLEEALRLARELPASPIAASVTGVVLNNLSAVHRWAGRFAEADAVLDEGRTFLIRAGNQTALLFNLIDRSYLARDKGEFAVAAGLFAEALAPARGIGDRRYLLGVLEGIATVAIPRGDLVRGVRLLATIEREYQTFGMAGHTPHDRARRDAAAAAACSALGEEAYRAAQVEGAALSLDQAIALAGDPAPSVPLAPEPGLLTRRETEILQLLAGGLSNREIAGTLFIGERTIESHLERIYAKLGVRRRVAAIAAATRLGLLGPSASRAAPE